MKSIQQKVRWHTVLTDESGQRLDNFLIAQLNKVPKSLVYRIIRKGEVRVNKKRAKPDYKINSGDLIRIPPVKVAEKAPLPSAKLDKIAKLEAHILYEDASLIVVNKPSGLAVHGGSGLNFGLIEGLRALRPKDKHLELVHRIDRDTSGILLVAKKRSVLKALHEQLRNKEMNKQYLALVRGQWQKRVRLIEAPLQKNTLLSGERIVRVSAEGKPSQTRFRIEQRYAEGTLIEASPLTGRTHQIRVHCLHAGHPIAKDPKYGDNDFDELIASKGLTRLFLHAWKLSFKHPETGKDVQFEAPLDENLTVTLSQLTKQ
ncbi:23S rRNA pseudouridine(955/2504/2580) synthase RluC [Idiomarina sp. X4]|uniref:23S rRNA pseudouridine(955/2504/2580) synthase RluC n=1 Tax=unclassified Idiomarina TaxID=2614829 RepID=UPI000C28F64F|nr:MULTISPECIES: 23S rRNA pseudouridine(955/2504/2580) synthase RluC [unclassified Idiomarina]ATZ74304.1 23S rRNA pseudouridine(955/2504/2580) synthase RluC [Idiomarina sp. X4]RXS44475.1 23S rRNA pseudouridine(955/2504/2580) synthase RluC [Idiomarina sp. 29L]